MSEEKSQVYKPGCTGKKFYSTQSNANKFALRNARFGGPQRVYECPHCFGWHLSTMTSDLTGKSQQNR